MRTLIVYQPYTKVVTALRTNTNPCVNTKTIGRRYKEPTMAVHGLNQETTKPICLVGLGFKLSIQAGNTRRNTEDIAYAYD
jgi:hypothetical protein